MDPNVIHAKVTGIIAHAEATYNAIKSRKMKQTLVASSLISHIGHQDNTLRVWFKSGEVWDYHEVPPSIFDAMLQVDSVGKFFHANIKGKFKSTRVWHG
jgi:hypothetical protein